jgi:hypothetical protein
MQIAMTAENDENLFSSIFLSPSLVFTKIMIEIICAERIKTIDFSFIVSYRLLQSVFVTNLSIVSGEA